MANVITVAQRHHTQDCWEKKENKNKCLAFLKPANEKGNVMVMKAVMLTSCLCVLMHA